jgi:hypothetical protein
MKTPSSRSTQVQDLRCEYECNPLGIDALQPRLSWKLVSERRGVVQSAYEIRVTDVQGNVVWDTGKIPTDQSLHVAYVLLKQETPPSWLYAVKHGATTIWEFWDALDEEGNVHGSLNHYAYGAVGSWLYQVVAGIEPGSPGYKHTRFQPQPGGGLTSASARYASLYGEIASSWQIERGQFTLTVTVPVNTTATVCIPARMGRQVREAG